jgi:hypothetical protein
MVAPAAVALIVIVVIAVILYVVTLALFIATANQLEGSDKRSLLAAGAMIGISIPFIVVGAIFGLLHFGQLYAGKKNPLYMWMFIIMASIAAILVFIASVIGWVLGGRLEGTQKRNVQAASALSIVGAAFFVVAFIMMLILAKRKVPQDTRDRIAAAKKEGKSYEYTAEDKKAMRRGMGSYLKRNKPDSE